MGRLKPIKASPRSKIDPRKLMLWEANKRAKQSGLDIDIGINDIFIPTMCPVLSIPLFRSNKRGPHSPSLDRVDNTKGYIKGNVRVISNRANSLKNDGEIWEFEKIIRYMKSYGLDR